MRPILLAVLALVVVSVRAEAQHLQDRLTELFIFGEGEGQALPRWHRGPEQPRRDSNSRQPLRPGGGRQQRHRHRVSHQLGRQQRRERSGGRGQRRLDVQLRGRCSRPHVELGGADLRRAGSDARTGAECWAALTRTGASFKTLRGVDLDNLHFTFTHANTDFEGCDSIAGGDCSLLGVPTLENETIGLNLNLNVRLTVTSFLLPRTASATGSTWESCFRSCPPRSKARSSAQIDPFGPPPAVHFFGGTPDSPDSHRVTLRGWLGDRARRRSGEG